MQMAQDVSPEDANNPDGRAMQDIQKKRSAMQTIMQYRFDHGSHEEMAEIRAHFTI